MKDKLMVGVIGAGGIVENSHLPVLKNLKQVRVAWLYDQNTTRSNLLSSMYNVEVIGKDEVERGISQIDICLLAIPYGARHVFIETCAAQKKALYVEKPFSLSVKEHEYFNNLFPVNKLAVGFQRRYYRINKTVKALIDSQIFGQLEKIKLTQGYFTLKGGSGYLSNAELAGGGVIVESGIHALDQILVVTQAQSVNVNNVKSVSSKGIDYDTRIISEIRTATHSILVDCEFSTLRNLLNGMDLYFEKAVLRCNLSHDATITILDGANKMPRFNIDQIEMYSDADVSVSESFNIFWCDFIKSILTQESTLTLGISSLITTSWIEQIYKSIKMRE